MFPSLPSSLDRLASEGIVNFDSEAFIKDTAPRYVGAPQLSLPFEQPLYAYPPNQSTGPILPAQPKKDEFLNKPPKSGNPAWKKILAGGIIAGLLALVGIKYGGKLKNLFKRTPMPPPQLPPPPPVAQAAATNPSWFSRIPTWAKITAGSVAGLAGVFGIYKFATRNKAEATPEVQPEAKPVVKAKV